VGSRADPIFLRASSLRATLGVGQLVNGYFTSPIWDLRQTGAFARLQIPWAQGQAEALLGNLLAPQRVSALRLSLAPLGNADPDAPFFTRFLSRLLVGAEGAFDFVVPRGIQDLDAGGRIVLGPDTASLMGGAVNARWALFPARFFFQLEPYGGVSGLNGLSPTGLGIGQRAWGALLGTRAELQLPWIGISGDLATGWDEPGHRHQLFDVLYEIDKRQALVGSAREGGSLLTVPAPGGALLRMGLETSLGNLMHLGTRFWSQSAPGQDTGEVFARMALGPLRAGARLVQRDLRSFSPEGFFAAPPVVVTEAGWALWGPLALSAWYWHTPRRSLDASTWRFDHDVMVGVSGDLAFTGDAEAN
jgi:hypothetical protein